MLAPYGNRLICVRYRYDPQRKKRLKTVELLVGERDWEPRRPPYADDEIVGVRIGFAEVAVRELAKQGGGKWNPERKGLGAALPPGGRAEAGHPHRERRWHPIVDTSRRRHRIHAWMLT